jgi:ribosomal protein L34
MIKRTLNGTFKKSLKVSGFFSRMLTSSGRKILKNRRKKHRYTLCIFNK